MTQHIERYQLSEDWILSYGDAKSKYSPKVNFEISHTLESSILLSYFKDLVQKQYFHFKIDLSIDKIPILFTGFPKFKSLFLKINFSPICYDVLNKIAISQEGNV